ncbi:MULTISPECIES: Ltp family lipoprotein [Lactiplantibacillus]|uniref:Ltp family lipoprotein n=1 Tax=Lactiplantibacillus pentosus TaxID=1589 RepID=A0AAP5PU04_LACPE|nr:MULTISPECIES: Ltp family lipoprotein [Lactiplantibacillus]MCE6030892.1 Ltp family lipoprotein [Lactiplantibacillus pentosus]MCJ8183841.1 Ltp family lipoprotein [Lactiplantibacillus pentosus]MDT6967409.1 Ltp family lipoprotein [Lactiplantibacillus pentosus]MDT7000977.1 Ltp family lipoprotein [Lactiplantibacillus pentosus]MDT7035169.1 Ltp family lipoprotein [Lactiplantibacillus pentosus]
MKKKVIYGAVIALVLIVGISLGSGKDNEKSSQSTTAQQERTTESETAEAEDKSETTETKESEEPAKPAASTKSESKVPMEHQAALKKAQSYARHMDMSEAGVREQLASSYGENFTPEAVTYAMEHLEGIDWEANALAKAKSYQKNMAMSTESIREQLTSDYGEQFTSEQADYAIQHLPS